MTIPRAAAAIGLPPEYAERLLQWIADNKIEVREINYGKVGDIWIDADYEILERIDSWFDTVKEKHDEV